MSIRLQYYKMCWEFTFSFLLSNLLYKLSILFIHFSEFQKSFCWFGPKTNPSVCKQTVPSIIVLLSCKVYGFFLIVAFSFLFSSFFFFFYFPMICMSLYTIPAHCLPLHISQDQVLLGSLEFKTALNSLFLLAFIQQKLIH